MLLANVCQRDLPFSWRGQQLTNSGVYSDTTRYNGTSCDSIRFYVELTIDSVSYDSSYQVVCQDNLPLIWRGQSITQNGWFYDTVFAQSGCDSISYATLVAIDSVNLILLILPAVKTVFPINGEGLRQMYLPYLEIRYLMVMDVIAFILCNQSRFCLV